MREIDLQLNTRTRVIVWIGKRGKRPKIRLAMLKRQGRKYPWHLLGILHLNLSEAWRLAKTIESLVINGLAMLASTQVCISEPAPGQASQEHALDGAGVCSRVCAGGQRPSRSQ